MGIYTSIFVMLNPYAGLNEHKRNPPRFESNRLIFTVLHHPIKTFMFAVEIVHLISGSFTQHNKKAEAMWFPLILKG